MNKAKLGIITGIIFGAITIIAAGTVLAAQVLTNHGSVTVTNPQPPPLTYTFKVYDAAIGGTEITDGDSAFFALGSVAAGGTSSKTVYVQATGTGAVTVTPAATWTGASLGTFSFNPPSVGVNGSGRQAIQVTFTAGASAGGPSGFDITYTGTP